MRTIFMSFTILLLLVGVYLFFNYNQEKSKEPKKNYLVVDDKQKIVKTNIKNLEYKKESNIKNAKKAKKETPNTQEIVTNSKVLKTLATSLKESDFATYDKAYDGLIKDLREQGDHTQVYDSFKSLLEDNNFSVADKSALLDLLISVGTEQGLQTYFEIFHDGVIKDKEVIYRSARQLATSRDEMINDPYVDTKSLAKILKKNYRDIEDDYLKSVVARLISGYDSSPETQLTFFKEYLNAKGDRDKNAAYAGLMKLNGEDLLSSLRDYLSSDYDKVRKTAGMILANMATDKASATMADWVMNEASIDNIDEIKRWFGQMMQTDGVDRVLKNIEVSKIKDEDLKRELIQFFDEEKNKGHL